MEQKEIDFWEKVGTNPEYMYITDVEPNETIDISSDTEYF